MFAGAAIGQAIGGGGVLFLSAYTGFSATFFFVALAILAVTCLVVLPMKEAAVEAVVQAGHEAESALRKAGREMREFAVESFRAFLATRGAFAGVAFNLLPAGAMALGLATRSSLSAEFGLSNTDAAQLELWSNVIAAGGMVLGGWLSDRFGRRLTLFTYIALMSLPTAWLAWRLQQLGYIMPRDPGSGPNPLAPVLASALWVSSLVFQFFMGLMYGTRSAIMMDVTNPKVAGTQFTAYMAMANLAIAYSATWHGLSAEALGYPKTLFIDACVGLLSLLVLPLLKPVALAEAAGMAAKRARLLGWILAIACLAWLPFAHWGAQLGAAQGIVNTFFTLGFIASGVLLLAAAALLPRSIFTRAAPWMALALLLLYARRFFDPSLVLQASTSLVALAAALMLLKLARHSWRELD
jgi:PAT family beta-lactamase induction signal transducer AmpG